MTDDLETQLPAEEPASDDTAETPSEPTDTGETEPEGDE